MSPVQPASGLSALPSAFLDWLKASADGLDTGGVSPSEVLPALADAGLTRVGVPISAGGDGAALIDAVTAIKDVASRSLTAAFVLWGHRTYIEYLLQSPNARLRERLLPDLLAGKLAGATGLSNAMKHLEGLEELQFHAPGHKDQKLVSGNLPWVTNVRPEGFVVAVAVSTEAGAPLIASLSSDDEGLIRSQDLDLLGLRSSNTAALSASNVSIGPDDVLHFNATTWLPQIRPAFLGLQCGLSLGLARRALTEAGNATASGRSVLRKSIAHNEGFLEQAERDLFEGLRNNTFRTNPAALFRIRLTLADIVVQALGLELQASGGRAYLSGPGRDFARRWREAAFIPVVTPSVVQLRTALALHAKDSA